MICLEVVYPGGEAGGRTVIVPGGLFAEGVYNGGPNKKAPLRRGFGYYRKAIPTENYRQQAERLHNPFLCKKNLHQSYHYLHSILPLFQTVLS